MNIGAFDTARAGVLNENLAGKLYYQHDYVTLRQQLYGTFVTPRVISITAESGRQQRKEQRVIESRGLHAHVH
jgi:hypothetical protein